MRVRSLAALLLCTAITRPALASFGHADQMKLCQSTRSLVRGEYQHRLFAVPPAVSDIMLAAMDGDTASVRRGLSALPSDQQARWRQTALSLAALDNQPSTVQALVADGANPNARSWIPPRTQRFYQQTLAAMKNGPHPDMAKLVGAMQKAGVIQNKDEWAEPPLFYAAQCNQVNVIKTLIHAGARVNATIRSPGKGTHVLLSAVINGNAKATRILLDHGASPCLDDRLMAQRALKVHRRPAPTLERIGRDTGLPAALVARLQCHAP